jgi:uncharacterized caspase-like protein
MTRRALLIGAETYGLSGCNADVALMRDVLAAHGFDEIAVRTGDDASRAGIIDGLEQMVAGIRAGDAALLYYSGHGGRVARPDFEARKAARLSPYFQFVVPTDMDHSDADDFRGLLSEELTAYQRSMTDAFRHLGEVPNVTTILDCCHSGYMARDTVAVAKSIDAQAKMFRMRGIREHAAQLGTAAEVGSLATNLDAVRLVACQPEQSAFEFPSARGGHHGALTDAFASVLEELGTTPLPWAVVGDLVRRRVRSLVPEQRPDLEGPSDLMVFSATQSPNRSAVPVSVIDGVATIEAATLLGYQVGDQFQVVMPGVEAPVGGAEVQSIRGGAAVLRLSGDATKAALDGTAIAVPTRVNVPKMLVHVGYEGGSAQTLTTAIEESTRLGTGPQTGAAASVASVDGCLCVLDAAGARWRTDAYTDDAAGRSDMLRDLDAISIGQRLLDLPSGDAASSLDPVVELDFGVVQDGTRSPAALHGQRLAEGTAVYLSLHNTGTTPLYVWVFDVGVSGRSSLITNAAPSGTMIGPAGAEDDTVDVWGPAGEALFWPDDVPHDPAADGAGRPETFVVLQADQRSDLSGLASRREGARGVAMSALDAILDEARTGVREVRPTADDGPTLRYRLDRVEFFLLAP